MCGQFHHAAAATGGATSAFATERNHHLVLAVLAPYVRILETIINMMMAVKRPSQPEDLPSTAVWLASDDAAMVTGQAICCDGRMWMLG